VILIKNIVNKSAKLTKRVRNVAVLRILSALISHTAGGDPNVERRERECDACKWNSRGGGGGGRAGNVIIGYDQTFNCA